MHADRDIVNFWLMRRGYSTVQSIKASRNRKIDFLAVRYKADRTAVTHVEVISALSGPPAGTQTSFEQYVKDRLLAKSVETRARGYVKRHYGATALERMAVIGEYPRSRKDQLRIALKKAGIIIVFFEDVLFEVLSGLDMQDYQNEAIRTLQVVKYQLLGKPDTLARLLGDRSIDTVLNTNTRGEFVGALLDQPEIIKTLGRQAHEERLIAALKASSLRRAERFAKAVSEVIGTKAKRQFLKHLLVGEKAPPQQKRKLNAQLDQFFG
ncbi:hypothetical protein JXB02_02610 [Candidatus Woesearchaeota archaeon]|nr:hypothetical protein [Candidatus Woesearchaeota archaeon]